MAPQDPCSPSCYNCGRAGHYGDCCPQGLRPHLLAERRGDEERALADMEEYERQMERWVASGGHDAGGTWIGGSVLTEECERQAERRTTGGRTGTVAYQGSKQQPVHVCKVGGVGVSRAA